MQNIEHFNNLLSPLISLAASIDEAYLLNLDLPLERPGLLEGFLDPEVQTALPAELTEGLEALLGRRFATSAADREHHGRASLPHALA